MNPIKEMNTSRDNKQPVAESLYYSRPYFSISFSRIVSADGFL